MQKATTKTALAAMLAAALVIPASAFGAVTHRATAGVMVCPGSGNPDHAYYFSNNNAKKGLVITEIEIIDSDGSTVNTWSPGTSMPTGLPADGRLRKLRSEVVEAPDMAAGNSNTNYPMQVRVSWESPSGKKATQPSIALVRNFWYDFERVSHRASGCRPINPND